MVAIESGKNVDNGYIDIDVSKMSTKEARKVKFNVDLDKYKNKVEDNDVAIEWGGDPKKLSRREARKYHDDFELHYITQSWKKGVLRAKRKPDKSTCALYNEKNEKLSADYDTLKPLQNEKWEWNRLFAWRKMGKWYCLVNEWWNECSKYYEHISDIVYKPVGWDFSTLSEGNPIITIWLELSYVWEKSDGTKVVVDRNWNETILSKK